MCILCVLQDVSGRAKAMLPWLVISLSALWAFSQLLPPPFRIDMTTARLVCFLFLVAVVFWQRILRPQLCLWQARRSARLRERRWTEAIEMQKLRKIAIRRCRNCLTPYREQNPGGGKFMCSYCGHISKRPVLDIPGPRRGSGIIRGIVGKTTGWSCGGGDWSDVGPRCLTSKSYSGVAVLTCRLLSGFFVSVRWFCRKLCGLKEDGSEEDERRGLSKKENGESCQESKGEKARRKAEEKRQARLEKEMLEEEDRKQREEVARLIEERRKLRDEKLEAEKEFSSRGAYLEKGRDGRKESEKKNRRKEKDKCSSKSNSDGEDLEKRTSRESEKKREYDRKSDSEKRDFQKACIENIRSQISEASPGVKGNVYKPRYFDRMTGSFLSSSRGFGGTNFFSKSTQTAAVSVAKPNKPFGASAEHVGPVNKREINSSAPTAGTQVQNGEDKISNPQPVTCNPPPTNVWKKSWHQLFTYSSSVSPCPDSMPTSNSNHKAQPTQVWQASPGFPPLNQIDTGSLFMDPLESLSSKKMSPLSPSSLNPVVGEKVHDSVFEETELFEDPCYIPDPISLLGPVSESLDNFPVDLGCGFMSNSKLESSPVLRSVTTAADISKPSPIESPMSRLRLSKEKHKTSGQVPGSPRARDSLGSPRGDSIQPNEQGTWQMWDTPLGLDSLGIVGGSASRLLPMGHSKLHQEDTVLSLVQKNNSPFGMKDSTVYCGPHSGLNNYAGGYEGAFSPLGMVRNDDNPWVKKTAFKELPGDPEEKLPLNLEENIILDQVAYENANRPVASHPSEHFAADRWSKAGWAGAGVEDMGSATLSRPHIGGLFPTNPDVQSVWSFK